MGVIILTTFTGPGGLLTNWVIVSKEMRKNYQSFPNSLQVRWPGVNNQKFISESPVQNFGKSRRSRELLITEGPDQFHLIQCEICFNLLFLSQLLSSTVQKIRIFYSKLFLDRFAICDEQRNTWMATDTCPLKSGSLDCVGQCSNELPLPLWKYFFPILLLLSNFLKYRNFFQPSYRIMDFDFRKISIFWQVSKWT